MRSDSKSVVVPVCPGTVWGVLTDPALTRSCLLGLVVESTFEVGDEIRFHGPGGVLLGGRILAHEPCRLLAHSLGDLSGDLVRSGLEEHDPSHWVTWTAEPCVDIPTNSRVRLVVDAFDDCDEGFSAWCEALASLARVLSASPPG